MLPVIRRVGRLVIVWGRLQLDASQVENPGITINLLLLPHCSPWTSLTAEDVFLRGAETAVNVGVAGSVPPLDTPALPPYSSSIWLVGSVTR